MSLFPVDDFDDDDTNLIKISTGGSSKDSFISENSFEDPFSKNWEELSKIDGLSPNFRKKANRLKKA